MLPRDTYSNKPAFDMKIRSHVRESDWPMIKDNWKKSYRHALYYLDDDTYFSVIGRRIDDLRNKARWAIAVDPGDDEFIFGWACFGTNAVHYVYVRRVFRRSGVARQLVQPGPWVPCTHWSRTCESYSIQHPGRLCYTPGRLEHERIGLDVYTKDSEAGVPEDNGSGESGESSRASLQQPAGP